MAQKFLLLIGICLAAMNTNANTLRIVCIGDSITQGGKIDRDEYTYRWPLFCKLVDVGIDFDFIGSHTAGLHA
ncbi:MAG: hypothetical protein HRT56_09185, partial [Coraliomargarita sp.]|nr:hypothetical protein [Coraliomargarita sp.]